MNIDLKFHLPSFFIIFLIILPILETFQHNNNKNDHHYLNIWAVKIDGDFYKAKEVAKRNNYELIRKVKFQCFNINLFKLILIFCEFFKL